MLARVRQAALLALAALALVSPVEAQLRPKLPRVGNPLGGKKSETRARTPTFNDRVLEITDARVDGLLGGLAAEVAAFDDAEARHAKARSAYEAENKAYAGQLAAYQKRKKEWDACYDREVRPVEERGKQDIEATHAAITGGDQAAFEKEMERVRARIVAAQQKGDMQEVMRLADSVQKAVGMRSGNAAQRASSAVQAAAATCGPEPEEPKPPVPPSYPAVDLEAVGAKAAGLTAEQYAILKERVRYAVDEEGGVRADPSSMWAFGAAELDVLEKRGREIAKAVKPLDDRGR
ncbi:MAG TPA: hypothetical protein VNK43_10465 [Gemmatimonadales bacterium]|nr:hypothetical protein [Gemmatimonadales bacterium]